MADERFLIVRLSSLGDIIFTLPMLAALRDTFCRSHIAWVVNERWKPLLEGNPDLNDIITLPNSSIRVIFCMRQTFARKQLHLRNRRSGTL